VPDVAQPDGGGREPVPITLDVSVPPVPAAPLYPPVSLAAPPEPAARAAPEPATQPATQPATGSFTVTVLPYHLWANRTPGAMRVWIPVAPLPLLRSAGRPIRP